MSDQETHNGSRRPVGGPVMVAWREGTLTRAKELESLTDWLSHHADSPNHNGGLVQAIEEHLDAAREAADQARVRSRWAPRRRGRDGPRLERAISNLDAAEADLLHLAPPEYLLGQMPCLLNHVQRHLPSKDPRRQEFERIAVDVGVHDADKPVANGTPTKSVEAKLSIISDERNKIVSIARGASSAGLREQLRVRSFRNVLVATALGMTIFAVGLAVFGWISPTAVPLCFQPEQGGRTVVVCPTGQSQVVPAQEPPGPAQPSIDALVSKTASKTDMLVVEAVGLVAAAVAAAAAVRRIRGSSEPHGLPVALALLKLPTGAVTAVLGILLMRGGFVPGLSALDSSSQIIAWAIVFGYAQQLFTRFADQQANSVLDGVRGQS